jgi:hypothetical protein
LAPSIVSNLNQLTNLADTEEPKVDQETSTDKLARRSQIEFARKTNGNGISHSGRAKGLKQARRFDIEFVNDPHHARRGRARLSNFRGQHPSPLFSKFLGGRILGMTLKLVHEPRIKLGSCLIGRWLAAQIFERTPHHALFVFLTREYGP